jgi:hypothetical protein
LGIAFSNAPIIDDLITGTSAAGFVAALDALLVSAGWDRIATLADGFKYRITSPQGLIARVTVEESGFAGFVNVHMLDDTEAITSQLFDLFCTTGREYRVTAGVCQMFLALPGVSDDQHASQHYHSLACGIPYIAEGELGEILTDECAVHTNSDETTEAWWIEGNGAGGVDNFRYSLICRKWSACRNGSLVESSNFNTAARLRIFPLRHPYGPFNPSAQKTQWCNGEPLFIDPCIGWGDTAGNPARVRGQVYDAMLASYDHALDAELETSEPAGETFASVFWRNYTHFKGSMTAGEPHSYHGSLYLRTGGPGGDPEPSNYAY